MFEHLKFIMCYSMVVVKFSLKYLVNTTFSSVGYSLEYECAVIKNLD